MSNIEQEEVDLVEDNQDESYSEEKSFEMLIAKALSNDPYKLTEEQLDKMIAFEEKKLDYAHKERTQVLPQHRFDINRNLFLTFTILGSFLIVFMLVLAFAPEHVDKLISLFAGLLGGYGFGKSNFFGKDKQEPPYSIW